MVRNGLYVFSTDATGRKGVDLRLVGPVSSEPGYKKPAVWQEMRKWVCKET